MHRTKMKELAEILEVSISTISKALSNSSEISLATRAKVRKLAEEYNYRPNDLALSFRTGQSRVIGLVLPNMTNPFFGQVLTGVEHVLSKKGYRLSVSISNESSKKESKCIRTMTNGSMDGIIVCPSRESLVKQKWQHLNHVLEEGMPMVVVDRVVDSFPCDQVGIDDLQTSYDATLYLINKYRSDRIAFISLINDLPIGEQRFEGYSKALLENGGTIAKDYIITSDDLSLLEDGIRNLLASCELDAVFCANGAAVCATVRCLGEIDDKSLDALPIMAFCPDQQFFGHPGIMVIDQNAHQMGERAGKLLLKRINDQSEEAFSTSVIKSGIVRKPVLYGVS